MKQKNLIENQIIDILIKQERVTRQELVRRIGVRPATLFEVVRDLKARGVVDEPERKGRKTGRKASPICLDPQHGFYLGIELDVPMSMGVLVDNQGAIVASAEIASTPGKDAEASRREVAELVERLKADTSPDVWAKIRGLGFADPGLVDSEAGVSLKAVNIQGWEDAPTGAWLRGLTGFETFVVTSCLARTYIESLKEAPFSDAGLFLMTIDSGVGGGFLKGGQLFVGDSFCGMEVGHLIVKEDGPMCQCGNRGCLEALAGSVGVQRQVERLIASGVQTRLAEREFSVEYFVECARKNDKAARSLALEVAEYIGIALSSVVTLLNPRTIVTTGVITQLEDILMPAIRRILSLRCFPRALEDLQLRETSLPPLANAHGAALLMRERALLTDAKGSV